MPNSTTRTSKRRVRLRVLVVVRGMPTLDEIKSDLEAEEIDVVAVDYDHIQSSYTKSLYPKLIVLDWSRELDDALALCHEFRDDPRTQYARILIVSASKDPRDEVAAFKAGADDYVIKPVKHEPLFYRIKALLHRSNDTASDGGQISLHGLTMNQEFRTAKLHDRDLELSRTEFALLWSLACDPGRVFIRKELIDLCRGFGCKTSDRAIDVHVRAIRIKLGAEDLVEAVYGVGYRFRPSESSK